MRLLLDLHTPKCIACAFAGARPRPAQCHRPSTSQSFSACNKTSEANDRGQSVHHFLQKSFPITFPLQFESELNASNIDCVEAKEERSCLLGFRNGSECDFHKSLTDVGSKHNATNLPDANRKPIKFAFGSMRSGYQSAVFAQHKRAVHRIQHQTQDISLCANDSVSSQQQMPRAGKCGVIDLCHALELRAKDCYKRGQV